VLLGQSYHKPHGAVIDENGMMISKGKMKNVVKKKLPLFHYASHLSHLGLNPDLSGEKPVSNHLSYIIVVYQYVILPVI
jgi:hypothetical protein